MVGLVELLVRVDAVHTHHHEASLAFRPAWPSVQSRAKKANTKNDQCVQGQSRVCRASCCTMKWRVNTHEMNKPTGVHLRTKGKDDAAEPKQADRKPANKPDSVVPRRHTHSTHERWPTLRQTPNTLRQGDPTRHVPPQTMTARVQSRGKMQTPALAWRAWGAQAGSSC